MMLWAEHTIRDLRFVLRGWRSRPTFPLAVVTTLALGIGANAAIFSVVSGVLLRPLPFPRPGELVDLSVSAPADPGLPATFNTTRDLESWRQGARSLQASATYSVFGQTLQGIADPEQLVTVRADRSFFATLGVQAVAGHTFRDDDPSNAVVASFGFWRRHFNGDRTAIGRTVTLDGEPFILVGVMPNGFQFPYRRTQTDLWTLWVPRAASNARLDAVIGRLKTGVAAEGARRELSALSGDLSPGRHANVTPLSEVISGPVRTSLLVLLGAAGLVLLVACANVANLLLVRATARRLEVAVRTALGAGRWRLMRQFLTESLLLALSGGLLGLAIGFWGSRLLVVLAGHEIPRAWDVGFDWRVFAFLVMVSAVAGVGFGLAPALGAVRGDDALRDLKLGGRGTAARLRLRDGLVVAEVALAFILLTGAGLLLRTFINLRGVPTGFNPAGVLTLHVAVADAGEARTLIERVALIPGVRAAGFVSLLPLQSSNWAGRFSIAGRASEGSAEFRYVTPGYFEALSIPILRGRLLSVRDTADAPKTILINEAFANQFFPHEDPVGLELTGRGTIVGVVGNVRASSLDRPAVPEIYYPVAQNFAQLRSVGSSMVVKSALPPESLVRAIRRAIGEINPGQATFQVATMDRVVDESLGGQRLYLWLMGVFAAMAVLLAVAGIYGVIAYLVSLRTREFGIRMALGANTGRVLGLVIRHGAVLVGLGVVIGLGGAIALTRFLERLLYGVGAADPATFGTVGVLLAAVAIGACVVPARRASRIDPARALRAE